MNLIKTLKTGIFGLLTIFFLVHCSDNSYLQDGGTSNPHYDGTVLDYLNSRPDYFTKLVEIIHLTGMEDVFTDSTITFFAPTDYSIDKSLTFLNSYLYHAGNDTVSDLSQISADVWKNYLTLYLIHDKYLLKDIPQMDTTAMNVYGGQAYVSYNGRPMNIGVVYHDENGVKYAGYRQLFYSYIYDFTTNDLINAHVATSDIQPTNGVVHVLRFYDHYFGFNVNNFYNDAVSAGIKNKDGETNNDD